MLALNRCENSVKLVPLSLADQRTDGIIALKSEGWPHFYMKTTKRTTGWFDIRRLFCKKKKRRIM